MQKLDIKLIFLSTAFILLFAIASSIIVSNYTVEDRDGGELGSWACTADAMECPDGSYVGRVPPYCLFAPCPGV